MPYRPPSAYAPQIAAHDTITGSAVDFIDTPGPAMMLVPWPVVEAAAIVLHRADIRCRCSTR